MFEYLTRVPCANIEQVSDGEVCPCPKPANNTCKACRLVQYCSAECQKQHWPLHKVSCKSLMLRSSWKPAWYLEHRQPTWITKDDSVPLMGVDSYGPSKYLWGNIPAFSLLNCKENEQEIPHHMSFLFAASGDLRNVLRTVVECPSDYTGTFSIVINDYDFDIVARNVIFLLIAMHYESDIACPMLLHLWYSALVPADLVAQIKSKLLPLIQDVCCKIDKKSEDSIQAKTWRFKPHSVRVVLQKSQWTKLLSYFEVPAGLSARKAYDIRIASTLAPSRVDNLHRYLYAKPPGQRLVLTRFREDGILLPFGASRKDFTIPNPTFFQQADHWPMNDSADPFDGWSATSVATTAPLATNDSIGSLFLYVLNCIRDFHAVLQRTQIDFLLLQVNAVHLPNMLEPSSMHQHAFDRIETSNIVDGGYLGVYQTLTALGPMLRRKAENPHATLVALFQNATHEVTTEVDAEAMMKVELQRLRTFMPLHPTAIIANDQSNPDLLKCIQAGLHFRDFDMLFERYMQLLGFTDIAKKVGLQMKKKHTIIQPWPMRLKKNPTQKEFDDLVTSGHIGNERYVEWESRD